jgi:hypothetical protein
MAQGGGALHTAQCSAHTLHTAQCSAHKLLGHKRVRVQRDLQVPGNLESVFKLERPSLGYPDSVFKLGLLQNLSGLSLDSLWTLFGLSLWTLSGPSPGIPVPSPGYPDSVF